MVVVVRVSVVGVEASCAVSREHADAAVQGDGWQAVMVCARDGGGSAHATPGWRV